MKKLFLALFLILFTTTAFAADSDSCRIIRHKEGKVYVINSALYQGTHIRLPEKILLDPIVGDSNQWTVEGNGHHIMVQPNSAESQGKKTTLTLIDKNNKSYNFKLLRVNTDANYDICVTVQSKGKFFDETAAALDSYKSPAEKNLNALGRELENLSADLKKEKIEGEKRIDDVLKKYRSFIYTRYKFSRSFGFKGKNLVTDVYDDGRFTFIRVVPDNRGVLIVSAKIDGKDEMIEYVVESETMYRISGIYPEFTLKHGKSKVKIKRTDSRSNGVY